MGGRYTHIMLASNQIPTMQIHIFSAIPSLERRSPAVKLTISSVWLSGSRAERDATNVC